MTAGSLTHRIIINRLEILFRCISHGSRCIINRSTHHSDKRHGNIIFHHILLYRAPLHLFHAKQRFEVDNIRESPIQTGRLINAVQIQCQMIFSCRLGNPINHFNASLVVPVQKIYFKPTDAHCRIFLAGFFQLIVQYIEYRPKDQVNPFTFSISDQFFQIQFRNDCQHITTLRIIPTFIQHNIANLVFCGKVDVVLIGIHINAGLKVDIPDSPVVPPIPSDFS